MVTEQTYVTGAIKPKPAADRASGYIEVYIPNDPHG